MTINSKKAALEMSVGTIVTIVLVVTTMVLGLVLIREIFSTGTDAVENIDAAIQDEINKLFADEGELVVYPASRRFTLNAGDDPKGFAFSVRNSGTEEADYTYSVTADDVSRCGTTFGEQQANQMLIGGTGSFRLEPGGRLDLPRLVLFEVPETAPPCTIVYKLQITGLQTVDIFVTVK